MSALSIAPVYTAPTTSTPARKGKAGKSNRRRPVRSTSAVDQVRTAFSKGHRLSAFLGFILGGFVPVAVFTLVHDPRGVAAYPALWLMVAGGLGYSAPKVWKWGVQAFGGAFVSAAFVLLVEGTVTFSHIPWLAYAGLAVLVAINGIAAASGLQAKSKL